MRISKGIASRDHWTYFVLTYPHREWKHSEELYRFGLISWSHLRKRMERRFGKMKYIQTWEAHKSGYPHVNVIISNESLYHSTKEDGFYIKSQVLEPMAKECGFGYVRSLEPMRDATAMAGYMTKLAQELVGAAAKNQIPLNAPRHFRRIRASVRLLPKRIKDETITGVLMRSPADLVAANMGLQLNAEAKI